jgi:23S rRNA pseudouridine2605 synthase
MILVTNDGELANQLTHPRYGVEKRYLVRIVGSPNPAIFDKLRRGVHLAEGMAKVSDIRVRKRTSKFTDVEIVLQEGRNREIRRILARVGHKVVRLKRIAIGPLRLGELPVGESRALTREEVKLLQRSSQQNRRRQGSRRPERGERPSHAGPKRPSAARQPPSPRRPVESQAIPIPKTPVTLDPDEVEVTETPLDVTPGSIIGDDDWDTLPGKPDRPRSHRNRRGS